MSPAGKKPGKGTSPINPIPGKPFEPPRAPSPTGRPPGAKPQPGSSGGKPGSGVVNPIPGDGNRFEPPEDRD